MASPVEAGAGTSSACATFAAGLRSFRLDRVRSVRALEVGFTRPAEFDALGHLKFSVATLPRAFAAEVLLDTDLTTAQRELFPAAGVLEWVAEGVLLRSQVDDLHWFARELACLPFPFRIRRPAALRDAVESHARRLLGSQSSVGAFPNEEPPVAHRPDPW